MNTVRRIGLYNLLILLGYSALSLAFSMIVKPVGAEELGPFILLALLIGLHTLVNVASTIVYFTTKDKERGRLFCLALFW